MAATAVIDGSTALRLARIATAAVTAMVTKQTTTMAATAVVDGGAAGRSPTAAMTGNGHFLTADKGDADNRAEKRDAKDQRTIHPRILHKRYQNVRVHKNTAPSY